VGVGETFRRLLGCQLLTIETHNDAFNAQPTPLFSVLDKQENHSKPVRPPRRQRLSRAVNTTDSWQQIHDGWYTITGNLGPAEDSDSAIETR
jgi:hypothetical protein